VAVTNVVQAYAWGVVVVCDAGGAEDSGAVDDAMEVAMHQVEAPMPLHEYGDVLAGQAVATKG
jgi:hypothetical protein